MILKLKELITILGKDSVVLTGSLALAYHGLLTFEEAKDIDILLVNASVITLGILDKLQLEYPSKKFKAGGAVNYSFIYNGVKIDIWLCNSHENTEYTQTKDGVRLADIRSIVNAKLSIGRSKDWVQLMQYSRKIFDPSDFSNKLSSITNHEETYD